MGDIKECYGILIKSKKYRKRCPNCDYWNVFEGAYLRDQMQDFPNNTIIFPPWEMMQCGNCGYLIYKDGHAYPNRNHEKEE